MSAEERLQKLLLECLGCSVELAEEVVKALGCEACGRLMESWLQRRPSRVEALQLELRDLSPAMRDGLAADAEHMTLRSFGLALLQVPEELEDGHYWAEALDELAERSPQSFNTLHRYSTDISRTPFPSHRILEAFRPTLLADFSLTPERLYLHAAFFIHYGSERNIELRRHRDHSLLTINICLRVEQLQGCDVRFFDPMGLGGEKARGEGLKGCSVLATVPAGWALLHWGEQEHETLPIKAGERWSVILWFKER
eukprot:TRINITY_DN84671_c0_g1_i1.p1 TRINITY_DN84671_c0_g1~~TRINITY_DN84671_c0_g1_i1.p1  ORF type:complete len:255 (+),score=56.90 TRINITY_DN84671_c0_g1_i1:46-810(+)